MSLEIVFFVSVGFVVVVVVDCEFEFGFDMVLFYELLILFEKWESPEMRICFPGTTQIQSFFIPSRLNIEHEHEDKREMNSLTDTIRIQQRTSDSDNFRFPERVVSVF